MTAISVADIVSRAAAHSVANAATSLTSNTAEMIAQIAAYEHDVFAALAARSRFFWRSFAATSTSGTGNRSFDTATIGNVERIVRVSLTATDTPVSSVDVEDVFAEAAPRYTLLGTTITEVGSDWGAAGAVALTIGYTLAPAPLDPAGTALQTITLPEKYADLLEMRLASYLALKDCESRDPAEVETLDREYADRLASVTRSLELFSGPVRRRFMNPANYPIGSA